MAGMLAEVGIFIACIALAAFLLVKIIKDIGKK